MPGRKGCERSGKHLGEVAVIERGWVAATLHRLLMHDPINIIGGDAHLGHERQNTPTGDTSTAARGESTSAMVSTLEGESWNRAHVKGARAHDEALEDLSNG